MTARIICMASAKGGSGKTVLTATFGTFLSAIGKNVLMVDTDSATNGLTLFYIKEVLLQSEYAVGENRQPKGVYDLVNASQPPEIVKLKSGPHLIPASYDFKNTETIGVEDYRISLKNILSSQAEAYDYVILDAQAGSDVFAHIAMRRDVSHEVVIVSEYDPMSAAGVERLKGLFREDLTYVRTWVLLNKMLPDFVQSFSDFLEVAKYLSPIPWDADVVRAYARRKLALDTEYGNEHTLAVLQTVKGLFGDSLGNDLDDWTSKRATIIKAPIEQQYKDAELELESLLKAQFELRERRSGLSWWGALAGLLVYFGVGMGGSVLTLLFFGESTTVLLISTIVSAIIGGSLGLLTARTLRNTTGSAEIEVQKARLIRRIELAESRLSKLEALKEADLQTLIRDSRKTE